MMVFTQLLQFCLFQQNNNKQQCFKINILNYIPWGIGSQTLKSLYRSRMTQTSNKKENDPGNVPNGGIFETPFSSSSRQTDSKTLIKTHITSSFTQITAPPELYFKLHLHEYIFMYYSCIINQFADLCPPTDLTKSVKTSYIVNGSLCIKVERERLNV